MQHDACSAASPVPGAPVFGPTTAIVSSSDQLIMSSLPGAACENQYMNERRRVYFVVYYLLTVSSVYSMWPYYMYFLLCYMSVLCHALFISACDNVS